jgi:hypothetical protein
MRCAPSMPPDGFVAACASNQGSFYDRFDAVVLLRVPREVTTSFTGIVVAISTVEVDALESIAGRADDGTAGRFTHP